MTTLVEIEKAIHELALPEAKTLLEWMEDHVKQRQNEVKVSCIDDKTFTATAQRILTQHEPLLRKLAQ